jgi:hypothetical protein
VSIPAVVLGVPFCLFGLVFGIPEDASRVGFGLGLLLCVAIAFFGIKGLDYRIARRNRRG